MKGQLERSKKIDRFFNFLPENKAKKYNNLVTFYTSA